jgi:hypothetical protein
LCQIHCALCELGAECLKIIQMKFLIQGVRIVIILQQNSINRATDAADILIVWHLRKIVSRPEVLPSVTSGTRTDFMLGYLDFMVLL